MWPALALSLALGAGQARSAGADELVQAALADSPRVVEIEQRIEALREAVAPAGVWKDPLVAVEYSNMPVLSPWPGAHPMSGVQLKVQQTFPFPGKTGARAAVADARAQAAAASLDEARNQLAGAIRLAWERLVEVRAARALTEDHVATIDRFLLAVRARYEVGAADQHEVLRLQVLHDRLKDSLGDLDRDDERIRASLNVLAGREAGAAVETGREVSLPPPPAQLQALVEEAGAQRGALERLTREVEVSRLQGERARAEQWPDVTGWLGYRVRLPAGADAGDNFVGAGVSMPLPWLWNDARWGAKVRQSKAQAQALASQRDAKLDELRVALADALARWRRAKQKAERYEGELVPMAKQTLESAFNSYQVARAGFSDLFQAEVAVLELERAALHARALAARTAVEVDTLVGRHSPTGSSESREKP
jgi:outer membrane protein TolC